MCPSGLGPSLWAGLRSAVFILEPEQIGQLLHGGMSPCGGGQRPKRVNPIKQHILLPSHLLMSHWPKNVTCQSPKSRSQEVHFAQHEAKASHIAKYHLTSGSGQREAEE